MKITAATAFLFVAMGVVATPIESQLASYQARDNLMARFEHPGVSRRSRPASK